MATDITQVQDTNKSINCEFVKLTVPNGPDGGVYTFSSSYKTETFDSETISGTYTALGGLLGVSGHQRDLAVTSFDTVITLVGIDQTKIGQVLDANNFAGPKGCLVKIWRGFYNENYVLDGTPVLRYTGIVTGYNIEEDRSSNIDSFVLQLQCSSYKRVLEKRVTGRFTNPKSWNTLNGVTVLSTSTAYDAAMDHVASLNNAQYNFGQKLA